MPYLPAYILFALSVAFLANAFLAQIDVGDGRGKWQRLWIGIVFGVLFLGFCFIWSLENEEDANRKNH